MLVALPSAEISGVGGFASAIQGMCSRLGVSWIVVVIVLLVALNSIGGAASFLSSTSRLPFVAGIDRYLPQGLWTRPCKVGHAMDRDNLLWLRRNALCLAEPGRQHCAKRIRPARQHVDRHLLHPVCLSISGDDPVTARTFSEWRNRGFREEDPVAVLLASVGLITTILTIVLALVPSDDEPHKGIAIAKILGSTLLLVGAGAAVFLSAKWRRKT